MTSLIGQTVLIDSRWSGTMVNGHSEHVGDWPLGVTVNDGWSSGTTTNDDWLSGTTVNGGWSSGTTTMIGCQGLW